MKIKIQKVSGTILYVILAISLVILGMFYFGGEASEAERFISDPDMSQPAYTEPLIYWMYVLMGITIVITLVAALMKFASVFMDSPKEAVKSLVGIIALVVLLGVTWAMGSTEALQLYGDVAADGNDPFWLKLTDMFLYSIYFMMGAMILLIFGFSIRKKFM